MMGHHWKFFCLFAFLLLVILEGSSAQRRLNSARKSEQDIINSILNDDYDPRINPGGNDTNVGPTNVTLNIYVRNIEELNSATHEMKVQLTFRRQWTDSRLIYPVPRQHKDLNFVTVLDTNKIWTPDIFISNEKEARVHDFTQLNSFVRIYPNGEVLQSQRVSVTLSCPQILKSFPFDSQECAIRIASFGHTTQDVLLTWKQVDPVQITSNLVLPGFTLTEFRTGTCDSRTNTGTYSCLRIDLDFKRERGYYLVQVFIPCTMLIIMAWLSFWLDPKALVSRMTLVVAALALLVIGTARLNEKVPVVSYTKAIDWWTGVCLTFVFFAVIETVVANYWTRSPGQCNNKKTGKCGGEEGGKGDESKKLMEEGTGAAAEKNVEVDVEGGGKNGGGAGRFRKCWASQEGCAQKLDFVVRIAYPITFFLFVIVFFGSKA